MGFVCNNINVTKTRSKKAKRSAKYKSNHEEQAYKMAIAFEKFNFNFEEENFSLSLTIYPVYRVVKLPWPLTNRDMTYVSHEISISCGGIDTVVGCAMQWTHPKLLAGREGFIRANIMWSGEFSLSLIRSPCCLALLSRSLFTLSPLFL